MELIKVEFVYLAEDGSTVKKYLEGAELKKWLSFNIQVAVAADIHKMNPNWEIIKWETVGKYDDRDD